MRKQTKMKEMFEVITKNLAFMVIAYAANIQCRMLKKPECHLFDAEFSVMKQKHYLNMTDRVVEFTKVTSIQECTIKCTTHPKCLSFNFNKISMDCMFFNVTTYNFLSYSDRFVYDVNSIFYDARDKKEVSKVIRLVFNFFCMEDLYKLMS